MKLHRKAFFKINFTLVIIIAANFAAAQNTIDSLKTLLKNTTEDTAKLKIHNDICRLYYLDNEYDSSSRYGEKTIVMAQNILNDNEKTSPRAILLSKKCSSSCYNIIGCVQRDYGNYIKSLDNYFLALKIDEELNDKKRISSRLGNIAIVYWGQANYVKALEFNLKALKMAEELQDKSLIANILGTIGLIYTDEAQYPKALDYFQQALKLTTELGEKKQVGTNLGNIGIVYQEQGNYTEALKYYFDAYKINEEFGDKGSMAVNLANIGGVYVKQGDSEKGLEAYSKAVVMAEKTEDKNGVAGHLASLGGLYVTMKEYKKAFDALYRSLAISSTIGAMNTVKYDYENLSNLYEVSTIGLPDTLGGQILSLEKMRIRSKYYYKRFIAVRDTVFSEENQNQILRKEMNFEFEKKEAVAQAEHEKQILIAEQTAARQRIIIFIVVGIVFLVLIFSGIVLRALRITKKQKKIIEKQNTILEVNQKEIRDSMLYASRIQNALIASEKYIEKTLTRLMKN